MTKLKKSAKNYSPPSSDPDVRRGSRGAKSRSSRLQPASSRASTRTVVNRSPIVTFLGHVDHGKTSILDYIRKTRVQAGELGGITQHTSAYQLEFQGKKITFVDTPGHEAFTAMRMRGGQVADLVVLVVAANDGVKPQSKESLSHIKLAKTPFIVAFNKIDLPEANTAMCRKQLAEEGVLTEKYGGDVVEVEVSAKTGQGIDSLLEMIVLSSEMLELKADPAGDLKGAVLEGHMDPGRGPTAFAIIKEGTLRVGNAVRIGAANAKVKALFDFEGKPVKEAGPSMPVEIMGLADIPQAGDTLRDARPPAGEAGSAMHDDQASHIEHPRVSLGDSFGQPASQDIRILNLVIKADTKGTLEAILASLVKLEDEKHSICVIFGGVGPVSESDVLLATAGKALILGFEVGVPSEVKMLAADNNAPIRTYRIIYELIDDVSKALEGVLSIAEQKVKGRAEVLKIFKLPASGDIVLGCRVTLGRLKLGQRVAMYRKEDIEPLFESSIRQLHHLHSIIKEAPAGMECGVLLKPQFGEAKKGDRVEVA